MTSHLSHLFHLSHLLLYFISPGTTMVVPASAISCSSFRRALQKPVESSSFSPFFIFCIASLVLTTRS